MAHKKPKRSFLSAVPGASGTNGQSLPESGENPVSGVTETAKSKQTQKQPRSRRKETSSKKTTGTTPANRQSREKNSTPQETTPEKANNRRRQTVESKPAPLRAQLPIEQTSQKPFLGRGGVSSSRRSERELSLLTQDFGLRSDSGSTNLAMERTGKSGSSFRGRAPRTGGANSSAAENRPKTRSRNTQKSQNNTPKRPTSPLVYGARLLILGVGIGVMAGTLLSMFDPASRYPTLTTEQVSAGQTQQKTVKSGEQLALASDLPNLEKKQELTTLKTELETLAQQQTDLAVGALFIDVDTGNYVDLNPNQSFSAASTIKVPILVAFFQDVDAGKIQLDEKLTMRPDLIAKEAGDMQYKPPGTKFSALEVATQMIVISDNTATNMLIDRLGGAEALSQRFQSWGLTSTTIRNVLPDLEGTNTTSAEDMVKLMGLVTQGKLMSLRSRDRLLEIMRRTVNNSLLPQGLGEGAIIAHKTGDIGTFVGDVGMIDMPSGKRYLAAVIVKGPHNDPRSTEMIRQFSRKVYQFFSK
ncbi:MAG TPA: serine hydrolase [Halomicronema sp.]